MGGLKKISSHFEIFAGKLDRWVARQTNRRKKYLKYLSCMIFLSRAKETLLQMFSFYVEAPLKVIKMKISINQEP